MYTNLKYAFYGITNKTFLSILIIIQFTTSIILLYGGIESSRSLIADVNKITSVLQYENIYRLTDEGDFGLLKLRFQDDDACEKMKLLWEEVNRSPNFSFISLGRVNLNIYEDKLDENFVLNPERPYKIEEENKTYTNVKCISINNKYLDFYELKTKDGRGFSSVDFSKEEGQRIPVLLGLNYESLYNVGDTIEYFAEDIRKEKVLEVIGFLDKDTYSFNNQFSPESLVNLNDYIIFPQQDLNNTNYKFNDEMQRGAYISKVENALLHGIIISNNSPKDILKEVQDASSKFKLYDFGIKSADDFMKYYKEIYSKQILFINILFIITFLFSAIGMIVSMLNSIEKRMNEFGVHILSGATKIDIAKRIFSEIVMMLSISVIVAISIIFNLKLFNLNIYSIALVLIITIILTLIITVIPVVRIINCDLQNLIRRID